MKGKKREVATKTGILCLLCFLLLFFTACKGMQEADGSSGQKEEEKKIEIAMIFDNFIMERWQRDKDVFVSTASELGAEVNVQNANSSVQEQVDLLEYFIEKQVDVIVIIPIESEPLLPGIRKARQEGIKIISYDRLVIGAQSDLYVSFDNRAVGRLMGEAMAENLEKQDKVVMICGPKTDPNVEDVEVGFREVMEQKELEVVEVYYAPEWKGEYAARYIREEEELMQTVKGVMCGNDNLAGQAIAALAEQQLAGEVCVVAQDADLAACQRIVEGTQTMTVYKSVEKLAVQAAKAAVALALDEPVETEAVYEDGTGRKTPYICLEPIGVTFANMEEVIIQEGFHLREDVYLNRPDLLK
ncbi:MAG: sugar ABC transporter substrate-binding protein [Roseburia sp.]